MGEGEGPKQTVIGPQPGPQTQFLSSPADIVIYGGGAGGGKTYAELLEPLRHVGNKEFGAVIFRRTTPQITNEGGLWDESTKLYPKLGAKPREHELEWNFPSGSTVSMRHLEHDKTVLNWQGSQVPLILFDELTHFTARQFWYMLSRNRSMCGVRPYLRATCNPDADSWVAELIAWWIDQDSGYPIQDRAGVLRWFVRVGDKIVWADRPEELSEFQALNEDGMMAPIQPKSLTFIPAKLTDNRALMKADPGYMANLMALPRVERERLLGGNWKIRPAAGLYFQRAWCTIVDPGAVPEFIRVVRGWDLAATPKTESNDPDWTTGTRIGRTEDGRTFVLDHRRMRGTPAEVEAELKRTATADGTGVEVSLPQDPGSAGKSQAAAHVKLLNGYTVRTSPEPRAPQNVTPTSKSAKISRFGPFSAQAQGGQVFVVRGEWNEDWFAALEAFPEAVHDDDADSTSRAFNAFLDLMKGAAVYDLARMEAEAAKAVEQAKPEKPQPEFAQGSVEYMKAMAGL